MRNKNRFIKTILFAILFLAALLIITNIFPLSEKNGGVVKTEGVLCLVKPAFAQSTSTFPEDEAGISAYVNVGQSIDLGKVKAMLRGIRAEGDTYVIGIVELTGLPEEQFPQVYVSRDGWIVTYYSKFAPTSRIVQWYGYGGGQITTTTLEDAIAKICTSIGIDYLRVKGNIKYYHFKYPEATNLLLAADAMLDTYDYLVYSIPSGVVCYEGTWSTSGAAIYIDESGGGGGDYINVGYLTDLQLTRDKAHTVTGRTPESPFAPYRVYTGCPRGVAIVFVYR